jgi:hypothetical protein
LQRAQAQLAVAISRDPGAEVLRRRRDVLVRRHQLVALGLAAGSLPRRRTNAVVASTLVVVQTVVVALVVIGIALTIHALGGT